MYCILSYQRKLLNKKGLVCSKSDLKDEAEDKDEVEKENEWPRMMPTLN